MRLMKRIMLILPSSSGTIARLSHNLYQQLKLINVQLCVAILSNSESADYIFENEFIFDSTAFVGVSKPFGVTKKITWLKKLKREFQPMITIGTMYNCSYINLFSGGSDFKIGIFHSPYYQTRDKGILLYGLYYLSYIFVFSKLDKLYCVSEGITNAIKSTFRSIDRNKVETVYNLHDIDGILRKGEEKLDNEEEVLFEKKVILIVGRIEQNKSPERAIESFLRLDDSLKSKTNLIFIGDDVKQLTDELKIKYPQIAEFGNVIFLGRKENPYKYISRASCLLSTSFSEGLPGVLIESLLLNTPVVVTNSSYGVWEILSMAEKYDENFASYVESECGDGVITSNLAVNDTRKVIQDVENLKCAMMKMLVRDDNLPISFDFKKHIKPESIVNKFLYPEV